MADDALTPATGGGSAILSGQPAPDSPPDLGLPAGLPTQQAPDLGTDPQPNVVQGKPSVMHGLLMGALAGLAGSAHAKTFLGGLGAGAGAELNQQQLQTENQQRQQQLQMEQQRTNAQVQQASDEHSQAQASLATSHVRLLELQRAYDLAPKTMQDALNQQGAKIGTDLQAEGNPVVFSGSHDEAMQRVMAERDANPNTALNFVSLPDGSGKFNVIQITDPNRTNDKPVDVTIGYQLDGKPITKSYPAHSITAGKMLDLETNAASNLAKMQGQLSVTKAEIPLKAQAAGAEESARQTVQRAFAQKDYDTAVASDVTGWKPPDGTRLNANQLQSAVSKFAGGAAYKTAQDAERSYQMANQAYDEYQKAGGKLPTGAQSMLMLSSHLQTTFGNVKGARVTKDMIQEHLGARSVSDGALVAVQKLTNGDALSPKQWSAFHDLIGQSRQQAWNNAIQNAHAMRIPVTGDMVPADIAGKGQQTQQPQQGGGDFFSGFGGVKH